MIFKALIQSDRIKPARPAKGDFPATEAKRMLNLIEMPTPGKGAYTFRDTLEVIAPENCPDDAAGKFATVALVAYSERKYGGVSFQAEILEFEGVNGKAPHGAPAGRSLTPA